MRIPYYLCYIVFVPVKQTCKYNELCLMKSRRYHCATNVLNVIVTMMKRYE